VRVIRRIKKNVFFASVNYAKIGLRYEFIKIDALHKIKKEWENYQLINSNFLANIVTHIRSHVLFQSEFLGALRSAAETQENFNNFELYPLNEVFEKKI
jgi:alpha-galactosidase